MSNNLIQQFPSPNTSVANGDFFYTVNAAGNVDGRITKTVLLTGAPGSSSAGETTTITAGAGNGSGFAGGDLVLSGGAAGSGSANGGNVILTPAAKAGGGNDGVVVIRQPGGTPGTNEVHIYQSGNISYFDNIDTTNADAFHWRTNGSDILKLTKAGELDITGNIAGLGGNIYLGGGKDWGFNRLAAGVGQVFNPQGGTGWLQQTGSEGALANDFTDAAGTLLNTNLTVALKASRFYRIFGFFRISNTTAGDGIQFDLNASGGLTINNLFLATLTNGTNTPGTTVATALNGVFNWSSLTGTSYVFVHGYINVNAAGSLTLRAATNTHVSGTAKLAAGSWLAFRDTVTL